METLALDERGLLQPGVHRCSICEIPPNFCFNDSRWRLWDDVMRGLDVLCEHLLKYNRRNYPIILGGSFFSDKEYPDDIEATIVLPDNVSNDEQIFWMMFMCFEHVKLKNDYRLDAYPSLPGKNDFSQFFQYAGPKTAEAKGIGINDLRGVLQVNPW